MHNRFTLIIASPAILGFTGSASAGFGEGPPAIDCFLEVECGGGGEPEFLSGTPGHVVSGFVDLTSGHHLADEAKDKTQGGAAAEFIDTCSIDAPN